MEHTRERRKKQMSKLIPPHGGKGLTCCLLEGAELDAEKTKAAGLKKISISQREKGDLIMMGIGGFSPLTGFMTKADWKGVCENFLLADGTFWPIPVTLSASKEDADGIKEGDEIALYDPEGDEIMATMKVTEKFEMTEADKKIRVRKSLYGRRHTDCRGILENRQGRSSRRPDGHGTKRLQPGRTGQGAQRRRLSG
jgi:sulfate adenylyltransferase